MISRLKRSELKSPWKMAGMMSMRCCIFRVYHTYLKSFIQNWFRIEKSTCQSHNMTYSFLPSHFSYNVSSSHQCYYLYQIIWYQLFIRDFNSDFYRLFFGQGCGSQFRGIKFWILLHPDKFTCLFESKIYIRVVIKDTNSSTKLVLVLLI